MTDFQKLDRVVTNFHIPLDVDRVKRAVKIFREEFSTPGLKVLADYTDPSLLLVQSVVPGFEMSALLRFLRTLAKKSFFSNKVGFAYGSYVTSKLPSDEDSGIAVFDPSLAIVSVTSVKHHMMRLELAAVSDWQAIRDDTGRIDQVQAG